MVSANFLSPMRLDFWASLGTVRTWGSFSFKDSKVQTRAGGCSRHPHMRIGKGKRRSPSYLSIAPRATGEGLTRDQSKGESNVTRDHSDPPPPDVCRGLGMSTTHLSHSNHSKVTTLVLSQETARAPSSGNQARTATQQD